MLENAQARLAELEAGSRPEEIAEAMAGVDQAKAELANAESNLKRLKELDMARTVFRQETDDAETLVRSRQAQAEARQQAHS
jgi:multidrug resistance efflux pump